MTFRATDRGGGADRTASLMRQHTSAQVSLMHQHTSAYVSANRARIRLSIRQHTSA
jgi:hypothetical protein